MTADYTQYMRHCLAEAARAIASVAPNPMVGACIVVDGELIASGIHERYGEAHAEVNAISQLNDAQKLTRATLYVSLEPCNHFGKTPPCSELIIASKIPSVVIATRDPNPVVAGSGIAALRSNGITVVEGVLSDEARFLNRRFFTFHTQKRPYVILKWAQTADKFIAREDYSSKWISGESSRRLVHQWRSEEQAIMVGTRTALHDDPSLTVRFGAGRNPLRIVIDKENKLPHSLKLWRNEAPTLCFVFTPRAAYGSEEVVALERTKEIFPQILDVLFQRKIISLIVEGGAETLTRIIDSDLWDEARVFESEATFEKGITAPDCTSLSLSKHRLCQTPAQMSDSDSLKIIYNQHVARLF